jgi:hypothetical protein
MTGVIQSGRFVLAWTPSSLATLVGWWDASSAATITSSGGLVSAWASRVGSYSLGQATDANKPTTGTTSTNGLNTLSFDGNDMLSVASFNLSTTAQITVWFVGTVNSGTDRILVEHGANFNTDRPGFLLYRKSDNKVEFANQTTAGSASSVTTSTLTTTAKLIVGTSDFSLSTNETATFVNGTEESTRPVNANSSGNFASKTLFVGARTGIAAPLTGTIAEVGVCSSVLNSSDLASLRTYISSKWGTA